MESFSFIIEMGFQGLKFNLEGVIEYIVEYEALTDSHSSLIRY